MNIQGKVHSFLMEVLVGPVKICVESRKLIMKEFKIQVSICGCMCSVCMCITVCFLVCDVQKSRQFLSDFLTPEDEALP